MPALPRWAIAFALPLAGCGGGSPASSCDSSGCADAGQPPFVVDAAAPTVTPVWQTSLGATATGLQIVVTSDNRPIVFGQFSGTDSFGDAGRDSRPR
jgi:hypothetical protein